MLDHFFREVTDRSDDGILALQAVRDEDTGDVTDFLVLYANERAQDSMMCFRQGDMTHSTQGSVGSPKDNCKCELVGTKLCEQFPEHRAPNGEPLVRGLCQQYDYCSELRMSAMSLLNSPNCYL